MKLLLSGHYFYTKDLNLQEKIETCYPNGTGGNASAKQTRGMFRERLLRDWGHAAHLGWARLLHDRRRDLIDRRPSTDLDGEDEFHANHLYHNREQYFSAHR